MKNNWSYLVLGFFLTFCIAALLLLGTKTYDAPVKKTADSDKKTETVAKKSEEKTTSANPVGKILEKKNCVSCHSVSKLNIKGGSTGPDLSGAYKTVEGKHGKPIEEFLKAPSSAVMKGVIKDNPLTDKEREEVLKALKEASK